MDFIELAIDEAEEALKAGEVPVGCVIVHNNKVIARGRNRTNETLNGCRYAEFEAIDAVQSSLGLRESDSWNVFSEMDLYVTVEPCVMCAAALRHLGIRKVYYGCCNERFGGCGSVFEINTSTKLDGRPYDAVGGIFAEEAIMQLRRFYVRENEHAPKDKKQDKRKRILKPL